MPRLVRVAIAAIATGAVLLTGAWAGGSCAPARAEPATVRRAGIVGALAGHRESAEIPVADALVVDGQPMQLSVSFSGDSPAAVAELYATAFRARGLLPIGAADDRVAHVSSFDPQDGLQRSVTAIRERTGHTLVLLGVTDPRHPPRLGAGGPAASFPVPEDHRALLAHSAHDGKSQANSGQYVTALPAAEVAAFYRARLRSEGYAEQVEQSSDTLLLFAREGSSVSVAIQALDARAGAAVFVTQTEGRP